MISHEDAIAQVARAICKGCGQDPDMLAFSGEPYLVDGGYAAPDEGHPLWWHYRLQAKLAIDAVEQLPPDYLEMLAA